jgi:hypothetical protein
MLFILLTLATNLSFFHNISSANRTQTISFFHSPTTDVVYRRWEDTQQRKTSNGRETIKKACVIIIREQIVAQDISFSTSIS